MTGLVRRIGFCILTLVVTGLGVRNARAVNDPAVAKGVQSLREHAGSLQRGESAMAALALIKAEVPANDPALAAFMVRAEAQTETGGFTTERKGGAGIYEAAVIIMALANHDADAHRAMIQAAAQHLLGLQNANGSWDYPGRVAGDTSITQYAVLGLWEAEGAGARVPPDVWDRAAGWFLSSQSPGGSWNYHRDENQPETISMTAAGVGSLLICQRQLARYNQRSESPSPLLVSVAGDELGRYTANTPKSRIENAIRAGLAWLGAHFSLAKSALEKGAQSIVGMSPYYALYGIERVGALAERDALGGVDWFEQGRQYLVATQKPTGNWSGEFGDDLSTAWSILFLTRSTKKSMRRIEIRRLAGGTLLGGRGLPKDLSSMTVAGGRVVSRPMNGAVEKMLAVLEDPRAADNADAALAGLVDRYQVGGPTVLRPYKDRFWKMLTDRDPGLRKVAAWGLGRTGDLDVVPSLINALNDPDEGVSATARQGLQLLSRKIDGLGPRLNASPEERQQAVQRWRAWYDSIRPLDLEGQDDDEAPGSKPAPARSLR